MSDEVTSTVRTRKRRIKTIELKLQAQQIRQSIFPDTRGDGQLIIHYARGGGALFIEWQERADELSPQISVDSRFPVAV